MSLLYTNSYTLLGCIGLLLTSIFISIKHPNHWSKKSFMRYTSSKRIFIWVVTLLAASHSIHLENPWCVLAGILYLIFCIGIVPMVVEDVRVNNIPDFIDKCYGAGVCTLVSVVSLLYISLRLGSYTSLIHNHLGLVLNDKSYIPVLLITGIIRSLICS